MALGGGTFTAQNKILPGAYINFVSVAKASALLSERGIAAVPFVLSWGSDDEIFSVSADDFNRHCPNIFGYETGAPEMLPLREVFKNARIVLCYKLNKATAASCTLATAKYGGKRGNDIKIIVAANADAPAKFDVSTVLDGEVMDKQTVATADALTANNFVTFKTDATLGATAGIPLTGGADGEVSGDAYQTFLNKLESYSFHALACPSSDDATKKLFVSFTERMRDEVGAKFQLVGHNLAANHEGIISIKNVCKGDGVPEYGLVYWLTGAEAACAVNATCGNKAYTGEYEVNTDYTQQALEDAVQAGALMLHNVDGEVHVLEDINTFTAYTATKGEDFSLNQVIRVLDQIANDVAALFNKSYLDKVQNNASGRASLWNDIVSYHTQLQTKGAIENFDSKNVSVEQGSQKRSVVLSETVQPVCAMEQLYMSVVVE